MTDYIAVHRIERRVSGKPVATNPGSKISLSGDEEKELVAAGAVRKSKQTKAETQVETPTEQTKAPAKRGRKASKQDDATDGKTEASDDAASDEDTTESEGQDDAASADVTDKDIL